MIRASFSTAACVSLSAAEVLLMLNRSSIFDMDLGMYKTGLPDCEKSPISCCQER